jgi:uncharacterized membrane protein
VRAYLRSQLWFVPAVCIAAAVALSQITPILDRATAGAFAGRLNVDSVRSGLSATASGMIAFTGFVFAINMFQIQFGSTALSPRLLRLLRQDGLTKAALGTFTATFVYALATLIEVGSSRSNFVPGVSWVFSIVLLLSSIAAFLLLLQRSGDKYRPTGVLKTIARAGRHAIDDAYPTPLDGDDRTLAELPTTNLDGPTRVVRHTGPPAVVTAVDFELAVEIARREQAVIWLVPRVGHFLVDGAPLFRVLGGSSRSDRNLCRSVTFSEERTVDQDPLFAVRLLVDVAIKALYTHDPTTVVQVLDHLDVLLHELASRRLGSGHVTDRLGAVRLVYPLPSWDDYLQLAVEEIRLFGAGSPQVLRRLRALLIDLHDHVELARRPAVSRELAHLDETVALSFSNPTERAVANIPDRQGLGSGSWAPASEQNSLDPESPGWSASSPPAS